MSAFFAHSSHMPCAECGASVAVAVRDTHVCDPERVLDYRMFQLRDELVGLDGGLRAYLDSPQGRFAQWLAERERRGHRRDG
ncbi:MAG: hypothetical protein ACRDNY_13865 [Gaiellaceae bacterium]